MATLAERREALEQLTSAELAAFENLFGGTWYTGHRGDEAAAIETLLSTVEHHKSMGDLLDRKLGLLTDDEQLLKLHRQAVATSTSSTRASWVSAHVGWIGLVIAVAALIVGIIALVN